LKKRPYIPHLYAALSGLVLFFCYPNFLGISSGALGWVVLAPLFTGLYMARSVRGAAMIAGVFGLVGYPFLYHWLVYTMHAYGGMGYPVSVLVLMALVLVLAAYMAAFGAAYHALRVKARLTPLLAAPLCWAAIEFIRAHFPFGGFPWALMGYTQYRFLPVIQVAELTGPYGVSFMVVLVNAALAAVAIDVLPGVREEAEPCCAALAGRSAERALWRSRLLTLAFGAGVPVLAALFGWVRMGMVDREFQGRPEIEVGIVQANVDQAIKWSPEFFWQTMYDHLDLTDKLDNPDLVIWPEAAVTVGGFNDHFKRRSAVIRVLERVETYLLAGSLSRESCQRGRCYYNSAYLLSPGAGKILSRYDKMRLVPFSEYVPMERLFFFAEALAQGNTGSTTPGREVRLMQMPEAPFGCVICYEVIFPHIVRRFVKKGATFMTTITNDAWFGKTGAPYQHHAAVVFRSVENRVYFARSANTGISSITDPDGRVLHATDIYVPASFTGIVKTTPVTTLYTRFGDWFAWMCLLTSLLGIAFVSLRERKKGVE